MSLFVSTPVSTALTPVTPHQPASAAISTLSLHDALPICSRDRHDHARVGAVGDHGLESRCVDVDRLVELRTGIGRKLPPILERSEEHTSELQSHVNLVCRLLLEKKKTTPVSCTIVTAHV